MARFSHRGQALVYTPTCQVVFTSGHSPLQEASKDQSNLAQVNMSKLQRDPRPTSSQDPFALGSGQWGLCPLNRMRTVVLEGSTLSTSLFVNEDDRGEAGALGNDRNYRTLPA